MKVCCGNGKPVTEMDEVDRFSCNNDHCSGPVELNSSEFSPEDMPIIEIDMSKVRQYKAMDALTEQAQELGLYEIDLLFTCGTFDTNTRISAEDICKLLDKTDNWEKWITSQIKQESVEKYLEWYVKMFERNAVCEELIEAHNKLFNIGEIK